MAKARSILLQSLEVVPRKWRSPRIVLTFFEKDNRTHRRTYNPADLLRAVKLLTSSKPSDQIAGLKLLGATDSPEGVTFELQSDAGVTLNLGSAKGIFLRELRGMLNNRNEARIRQALRAKTDLLLYPL